MADPILDRRQFPGVEPGLPAVAPALDHRGDGVEEAPEHEHDRLAAVDVGGPDRMPEVGHLRIEKRARPARNLIAHAECLRGHLLRADAGEDCVSGRLVEAVDAAVRPEQEAHERRAAALTADDEESLPIQGAFPALSRHADPHTLILSHRGTEESA